jgi:hypothetical protein
LRGPSFATIRNVFVKIGSRVEELKRKVSFPPHLPHADALDPICAQLTQGNT